MQKFRSKTFNSAFSLVEISVVILIIGILVAGISSGYDMFRQFKITSLRNLTLNSPVIRINDLYSWHETLLDESFNKNEALQGFKITNWYDVNKKHHLQKINYLQSNVNLRPSYVSSGINNLPAIVFSGANYMISALDTPSILERGSATLFFVFSATGLTTQRFLITQNFVNCSNNIEIGHNTGNQSAGNFGIHSGCYRGTVTPANTILRNEPVIISMVILPSPIVSGSVANIEIYKNGGNKLSLNADTNGYNSNIGGAYPRGSYSIYLGARYDNYTSLNCYFSGLIGEVIIYSRSLADVERKSVEEYLGKKWGIKIQ